MWHAGLANNSVADLLVVGLVDGHCTSVLQLQGLTYRFLSLSEQIAYIRRILPDRIKRYRLMQRKSIMQFLLMYYKLFHSAVWWTRPFPRYRVW